MNRVLAHLASITPVYVYKPIRMYVQLCMHLQHVCENVGHDLCNKVAVTFTVTVTVMVTVYLFRMLHVHAYRITKPPNNLLVAHMACMLHV